MGDPSFSWFLDFWTCPFFPKPIILIFGDSRTPKKNQEDPQTFLKKSICINLRKLELHDFANLWIDGHRTRMKIRLKKSWKSWIWDQYLSKSTKWKICSMVPISFKNLKGIFEIKKPRNQGPLKPWNKKRKTKKSINQKPRTNNQETKKPRNQETLNLFISK